MTSQDSDPVQSESGVTDWFWQVPGLGRAQSPNGDCESWGHWHPRGATTSQDPVGPVGPVLRVASSRKLKINLNPQCFGLLGDGGWGNEEVNPTENGPAEDIFMQSQKNQPLILHLAFESAES